MCRGREIGEAEAWSRQPAAMVEQVIEIIEVLRSRAHGLAQNPRVWTLAIDEPLPHSLVHQRLDRLAVELDVEPFGHPADLCTKRRIAVDHRHAIDGLVEIFDDRLGAD